MSNRVQWLRIDINGVMLGRNYGVLVELDDESAEKGIKAIEGAIGRLTDMLKDLKATTPEPTPPK